MELASPGRYTTDGFVVTYRDGVRRGRQKSGVRFTVYTPGEQPQD